MRNYLKLTAAAVVLVAGMGAADAQTNKKAPTASASTSSPARLGGKPNLNGIWQVLPGANYNLEPHDAQNSPVASRTLGAIAATPGSLGVVEGGTIPYKADAVGLRDENRKAGAQKDPEAACYLPGIPRASYMDHPFQIIQGDNGDMLIAYEYASANRTIHMKPVEVPPIDTWMGTSFGAWEGDTLKVVTLGLSPGDVKGPAGEMYPGVTWLDRSGNYVTNTATITERFKPEGPDLLMYEVTVDDPTIYSKPWKFSMPIYRHKEKNAQLMDFRCVPFAEELLYGDLLADKDKYPKK